MSENSSNSSATLGNTPSVAKRKQVPKSLKHCFTFNNYKSEDIELLKNRFEKLEFKYIFGEEIGENGTHHLQGFIQCPKKMRDTEFNLPKEIHWENCKGSYSDNIKYCSKEARKIYANIPYPKPIKIFEKPRLWQEKVIKTCETEPDDRTINWLWEEEGKTGKTALCKYLVYKKNALYCTGSSKDIFYAIVKYNEENGCYPNIVLIDIPRSKLEYINYEAIEKIKDGIFFSGKYESTQVVFNSPHVFVFANEKPVKKKLSKDRWKITHIDPITAWKS